MPIHTQTTDLVHTTQFSSTDQVFYFYFFKQHSVDIYTVNNTANLPLTRHVTRYPTVRAQSLEKKLSDFNIKPLSVQLQKRCHRIFFIFMSFLFLYLYKQWSLIYQVIKTENSVNNSNSKACVKTFFWKYLTDMLRITKNVIYLYIQIQISFKENDAFSL